VKPELKRKCIGTRLIASVKEFCRTNDLNRIELDVRAFNEKAKGFFEEQGFEVFGTRLCFDKS
jgi:ribosomal protein S18 acetylase RimI-like enzyme